MEQLKIKILELTKKSIFLNRETLKKIVTMIDNFSKPELENILELLNDSYQKTIQKIEKELAVDSRLFEHAKLSLIHNEEDSLIKNDNKQELKELDALLLSL